MKLGIIGAGQLAAMLAAAAEPLDIPCLCLTKTEDDPARYNAALQVIDPTDTTALTRFMEQLDCMTFENENVESELLARIDNLTTAHPSIEAVKVTQDRLSEKQTCHKLGLKTARFAPADNLAQLRNAVEDIALPCIVKTRRLGYDGKGQFLLRQITDIETAWQRLQGHALIVEQKVDFDFEVSIIVVRGRDGTCRYYPLTRNTHRNGILWHSAAPYEDGALQRQAEDAARLFLEHWQYVGVLAIEFFVKDGQLYVNELAPRVHNSGHWTIEGAVTSQFANHVRAVCGYPLGETTAVGQAEMFNCIGHMPNAATVLAVPGAHYHHYHKTPRPGRKLGHITLVDGDESARRRLHKLIDDGNIEAS